MALKFLVSSVTVAGRGLAQSRLTTTIKWSGNPTSSTSVLVTRGFSGIVDISLVCRHVVVVDQVKIVDDLFNSMVGVAFELRLTVHVATDVDPTRQCGSLVQKTLSRSHINRKLPCQ